MNDNEFLLFDRLTKIRSVISKYGEGKFSISFSGGKDSTVLSALVDEALPGNQIPRVYVNTGIDLEMVRDFVFQKEKSDGRFFIITPHVPIKPMLEKEGYPFKSKRHAHMVDRFQRVGYADSVKSYLGEGTWGRMMQCPKILHHQFTPEYPLRISDRCCYRMKEQPLIEWERENGRPYPILGTMRTEGGRREHLSCLSMRNGTLFTFQPMAVVTKEWEDWYIKSHHIEICPIYYPPYNFKRTGCKGCPFALGLQDELDTLERYFPKERVQCERIWGPVYKEYRRLGYRLDPVDSKRKAS